MIQLKHAFSYSLWCCWCHNVTMWHCHTSALIFQLRCHCWLTKAVALWWCHQCHFDFSIEPMFTLFTFFHWMRRTNDKQSIFPCHWDARCNPLWTEMSGLLTLMRSFSGFFSPVKCRCASVLHCASLQPLWSWTHYLSCLWVKKTRTLCRLSS